jgi:transcription initiation factor TFIIIB Brf1 subunit/transcription initiation factor TFIIB
MLLFPDRRLGHDVHAKRRDGGEGAPLPALCGALLDTPGDQRDVRTKTSRKTLQERAQMSAWIVQMRLPAPVGETAGEIATAWLSQHKQRGTARRGVLVAAVFHACRIRGATMTSKELARATGCPLPSLTEACKKMGAWVEERWAESASIPASADDLLRRSCEHMMAGQDAEKARALLAECRGLCADRSWYMAVQGRTPSVVLAAVIWTVVTRRGMSLSKKEVAEGCHVSVASLDRCAKLMGEAAADLPPSGLDLPPWLRGTEPSGEYGLFVPRVYPRALLAPNCPYRMPGTAHYVRVFNLSATWLHMQMEDSRHSVSTCT